MKWNAINYENRELTIRHTVTGNRTIYAEDKTKSKSGHRTLNLFPTAELCFKKLKQQQEVRSCDDRIREAGNHSS
ncbi:MAG: hypothetical protein LUI07_06970 [Lachnospiraceae bacterium]|nr:hypothetical protein [Lachnospiraceae bacterium]